MLVVREIASGAGRSKAGQRHAAEEPGVVPPHAAPPVRGRVEGDEI